MYVFAGSRVFRNNYEADADSGGDRIYSQLITKPTELSKGDTIRTSFNRSGQAAVDVLGDSTDWTYLSVTRIK